MGADGAERAGFAAAEWEAGRETDGVWAIERKRDDEWVEVDRFASREEAQQRLDEVAADTGTPLEQLRLTQLNK
ncbi:MAG TPA: hypothetical protein VE976_03490 [Actinomycetota bacterium]|jgi:hypothetical protein|nr:hypothetical protein [Actinomycetota bacterium]